MRRHRKTLHPWPPAPESAKGDPMKDEYDFSSAERGKFFREGARVVPPVHLDPEVLDYLSERASARGISLSKLVNTLLRKNIELIDAGR